MGSAGKIAAIHVGVHKTGTSVFQHYLSQNRRQLRLRRVLWVRRRDLGAAIGWGKPLVEDPAPVTAWVERLRRNPAYATLIGSYENVVGRPFTGRGAGRIYPNANRNFGALAAAMHAVPDVRSKVVLTLRPQAAFLESYYLQTVHQGGYETFGQWLRQVDLEALSWRPMVQAAQQHFGVGNVEIVDFRRIAEGQAAFLRLMLTRIDPRLDFEVAYSAPHNRSLSERGLQIALAVNPMLESGLERHAVREFLQTNFSNLDAPRPMLLTPELKEELGARYDTEYKELIGG